MSQSDSHWYILIHFLLIAIVSPPSEDTTKIELALLYITPSDLIYD